MIFPLFICAWCMPRGIPGTHGICLKCFEKFTEIDQEKRDQQWLEESLSITEEGE